MFFVFFFSSFFPPFFHSVTASNEDDHYDACKMGKNSLGKTSERVSAEVLQSNTLLELPLCPSSPPPLLPPLFFFLSNFGPL